MVSIIMILNIMLIVIMLIAILSTVIILTGARPPLGTDLYVVPNWNVRTVPPRSICILYRPSYD